MIDHYNKSSVGMTSVFHMFVQRTDRLVIVVDCLQMKLLRL